MKTCLTPDYWLKTAAEIRAAAAGLDDPEVQQALRNAADQCALMAERLQALTETEPAAVWPRAFPPDWTQSQYPPLPQAGEAPSIPCNPETL
jgi:hypothetical protein